MINKLKQHRKFRDFLTLLLPDKWLFNVPKQDWMLLIAYVDCYQVPSLGILYKMEGHLSLNLPQPFPASTKSHSKTKKIQVKTGPV